MHPAWRRLSRTLAAAMIAGLLLMGCGGSESEVEALASDFCDLIGVFADLDEDDFEAFMEVMVELEAREQEFLDLEERLIASDVDEAELEAAVRAECPEAFEAFDGF